MDFPRVTAETPGAPRAFLRTLSQWVGGIIGSVVLMYALAGYLTDRLKWISGAQDHTADRSLELGTERVVRGVASIHTEQSYDAKGSIDDVASAARRAGLDFVLIGDHSPAPSPWATAVFHDSVLIGFGEEVDLPTVGRNLVVGMSAPLGWHKGDIDEYWDRVAETGATTIIVHGRSPRLSERWTGDPIRADGWEVFDVSEAARRTWGGPWGMYHLGSVLLRSTFGGMGESLLRMDRLGFEGPAVAGYDSMTLRGPLTALAGLNHHPKVSLLGRPVPHYNPFFETLVNHVILRGDPRPSPSDELAAIQEAIRDGEVFISFGDAQQAASFRLALVKATGAVIPMGAQVAAEQGLRLVTSLMDTGGELLFRVVRNGQTAGHFRGSGLSVPVEGPGVYRVEAYRYAWRMGDLHFGLRPWIFSNPIHVLD